MMKRLLLSLLCVAPVFAAPTTQPVQNYGEPLKLTEAETIDVEKLLADPASFEGKTVRVRGKVSGVCAAKGCWLEMSTPAEKPGTKNAAMVKFTCPIEGRLIPMDAIGQTATLEGKVKNQTISEETAKHYAEEAGATAEEIEKIKGPQKRLRLMSAAARVGE
jgi:hypothetical protein